VGFDTVVVENDDVGAFDVGDIVKMVDVISAFLDESCEDVKGDEGVVEGDVDELEVVVDIVDV
jgi:hypothetical protein